MTMEEITLTIDGKEARGRRGETILNVCQRNGVDVPTLCHAKGLTDIGACRLCLVEIVGARGFTTACTTPASSGMVVNTDTPALNSLRRSTLELLFAERNHLCPFCEMSGDCELQALGYRFGIDAVRYAPMNPKLEIDSSSPYFVFDHNRCVLCRRCVRTCSEIAGVAAVGFRDRGAKTMVSFDLDADVVDSSCEACGACVQMCPTGALFDRRSAYKGRLAQCARVKTSCQRCSLGCAAEGIVKARTVLRIDGDFDGEPNNGLLCVKGRYESLKPGSARITRPLVRRDGVLVEAAWDLALNLIANRLEEAKRAHGSKSVVALATAEASNEQLYLLDWIFRAGFGVGFAVAGADEAMNRLQAVRRVAGGSPAAEADFGALRRSDFVLVLGADPSSSHPVIASILRRRANRGDTRLAVVGRADNPLLPFACIGLTPKQGSEGVLMNGLQKAIVAAGLAHGAPAPGLTAHLAPYRLGAVAVATGVSADDISELARGLSGAKRPLVLYGGPFVASVGLATSALSLALLAGGMENGKVPALGLTSGANGVAAAHLANGRGLYDVANATAVFVALGDSPPGDIADSLRVAEFLAVQAAYRSALTDRADVVLPAQTWTERHGSFTAGDGSRRDVARLVANPDGLPDDLETLAILGARLGAAASFADEYLAAKVELALAMPGADPERVAPVFVDYL